MRLTRGLPAGVAAAGLIRTFVRSG